jgi:cysteinyl-tRNA synthetase
MHNGMLQMDEEKMAKSVGNVALLHEAVEQWGRDALIMLFVSGHYRQPLQYSDATMEAARASVRRIAEAAKRLSPGPSPAALAPLKEAFFAALADDFNTPKAMAAVWEWVREANRGDEGVGSDDLREMLQVLGLDNLLEASVPAAPDDVVALARERQEARAAKEWAEADRLRDEILRRGWVVRDSPDGFALEPA